MTRIVVALAMVAACGGTPEQPPAVLDLTCPAVVEHVAKLTLRPIDYARPRVDGPAISDTDPRAFRQRRIDQAIGNACDKLDVGAYGPCARKVVLAAMATDCVDREWSDDRKRCLVAARDAAAIEACGPAPAPILTTAPPDAVPSRSLGEDCLGDGDCEAPARCVAWTTEGGEQHSTCELPCGPAPAYQCPAGRACVHQGGGPSGVCVEQRK